MTARALLLVPVLLALAGTAPASPLDGGRDVDSLTSVVAKQLRCPVCRQLSVEDSPSELAREVKGVIRERLERGETEEEVLDYFVSKYGEWILLEPRKEGFNLVVWILPLLGLVGGGVFLGLGFRRWLGNDGSSATDGPDGAGGAKSALVALLAVGAGTLLAAACGDAPGYLESERRRRHLESLGIESFDTTGAAPLAGVSARRAIRIDPLERRELGADTSGRAFHALVSRCGACHNPPSPRMHERWEWPGVVGRMGSRVDSAGLLPLTPEEREAIVELLREHAGGG